MEGSVIPSHLKIIPGEQSFPLKRDYVIMKADPTRTDEYGKQMIFCPKYDRKGCRVVNPKIEWDLSKPTHLREPIWVRPMNKSIFQRIGGVIFYNFEVPPLPPVVGLYYSISTDGPKYCATNQLLSDEVRHEKN